MDPVEKTFRDTFADFELPAGDDMWDQVVRKRQRDRRIPLLGLAASLALLITAGFLLWPSGTPQTGSPDFVTVPAGQPEVADHSAPATIPDAPAEDVEPVVVETGTRITTGRTTPVPAQPRHRNTSPVSPTYDPDTDPVGRSPMSPPVLASATRQIRIELPVLPVMDVPVKPVEAPTAVAQTPITGKGGHSALASVRTDDEPTGPARLVNMLQKSGPKVVRDILAFSSAPSTQIEINW